MKQISNPGSVGGPISRSETSPLIAFTRRPPAGSAVRRDLRVGALYQRFADELKPSARIFWADMLASAAVGWGAFFTAGLATPGSWLAIAAGIVATLALYRAVLFIHEIAHLKPGGVPGFETGWNLAIGIPMGVPSLMYVRSHMDHHRRRIYGTPIDPEYAPMAHWGPAKIALTTLPLLVVPVALLFRWAVLGPLSYLFPPLRRIVVEQASTLVINPDYRRKAPEGRERWRWWLQEAATCLFSWSVIAAAATGLISWMWIVQYICVTSAILLINHGRTLAAHRYHNESDELDTQGQLLDSVNLMGRSWLMELIAPVGLRYHALHHLLPALPYHNLGRVHRDLLAELPAGSVYRATETPGLWATLRTLFDGKRR